MYVNRVLADSTISESIENHCFFKLIIFLISSCSLTAVLYLTSAKSFFNLLSKLSLYIFRRRGGVEQGSSTGRKVEEGSSRGRARVKIEQGSRGSRPRLDLCSTPARPLLDPCSTFGRSLLDLCSTPARPLLDPCSSFARPLLLDPCSTPARSLLDPCSTPARPLLDR